MSTTTPDRPVTLWAPDYRPAWSETRGPVPGTDCRQLVRKLAEVVAAIGKMPKDGQVTGGGSYKFTSVDVMAAALNPLLSDRGVIFYPARVVVHELSQHPRSNGGVNWRAVVEVTWHVTDGLGVLEVATLGEALDTSDKGINKAQTAARKYAMKGLFNLTTADDPDPDHHRSGEDTRAKVPAATPPQLDSIRDLVARLQELAPAGFESEADGVIGWRRAVTGGRALTDLNADEAARVEAWCRDHLDRLRKKAAAAAPPSNGNGAAPTTAESNGSGAQAGQGGQAGASEGSSTPGQDGAENGRNPQPPATGEQQARFAQLSSLCEDSRRRAVLFTFAKVEGPADLTDERWPWVLSVFEADARGDALPDQPAAAKPRPADVALIQRVEGLLGQLMRVAPDTDWPAYLDGLASERYGVPAWRELPHEPMTTLAGALEASIEKKRQAAAAGAE